MAMTAAVKDELSRLVVTKPCCRRAEVAALLRFAGGLHIVGGRVVVEAEVDTGSVARRLRREIHELYGHVCEAHVISAGGLRTQRPLRDPGGPRRRGPGPPDRAARRPRPARCAACRRRWCPAASATRRPRGAARSSPTARSPSPAVAPRWRSPARVRRRRWRWSARPAGSGSAAKAREVRGADRVVIRDGDAIGALLTRMGAHESMLAWEERRMRREVRATANRLANFDDANLRRSARAAVAAAARVARALEILGDDVPEHLLAAGRLRVEHTQASLEELGQLADPPMTKDAVAGRIRRLLHMADKRAADLGIPDTESAVTAEMLEEA